MHAFSYATVAVLLKRHVKRHLTRVAGWLREFLGESDEKLQRKVVRQSSEAIDCATRKKRLSFEGWANGNEWETQQTSGITKTKLKFFIVNKRRESGFEGAGSDEMNLMPKLFINLVTFELSLSLFSAANFDFFPFTRLTTDDVAGMKRRLNWKSPPSAEFRSRLSPVLVCW